jgi:hypothetical protein
MENMTPLGNQEQGLSNLGNQKFKASRLNELKNQINSYFE